MTTKLLPAFVECFKDDRISVKLETIAVSISTVNINELFQPVDNYLDCR